MTTFRLPLTAAAAAAAVAVALGVAAPAPAAPKAVAPLDVGTASRVDDVRPFVSPNGEQLVAWEVKEGIDRPVLIAARNGGAFGPAEELSLNNNAKLPVMAFDKAGNGIAVWGIATNGAYARSAVRPAHGTFGAERDVGQCGSLTDLAMSADDRLGIACSGLTSGTWPNVNGFFFDRRQGIGTIATTNWWTGGLPTGVTPRVAWGADGTYATAVELDPTDGSSEIRVYVAPPGNVQTTGLQTIVSAPAKNALDLVSLDVLPNGSVAVVGNTPDGPRVWVRPAGGPWGAPEAIPGTYARAADADAAGTLRIAVTSGDRSREVRVVTKPLGQGVGQPVDVAPPAVYFEGFAVRPDGTEHALVWIGEELHVVTRAAGAAAYGTPIRVAGDEARWPAFAPAPGGDVLVTWSHWHSDTDERAVLGGIDGGTAPSIAIDRAPSSVAAGSVAAFAARATDGMGVASVRWDFGDGTSADGVAADHVYPRAGTYTATVTATDRAGNVGRETRVVTVKDAETVVREVRVPAPPAPAAPTPAAPPVVGQPRADRTAPTLGVVMPAAVRFADLRKGLKVKLTSDEPAEIAATLTGRARRATIAKAGDLELADVTTRVGRAGTTLTLKPARKLLGRARALSLTLTLTAIDEAGNRRVVTRTVRVTAR